MRVAIIGASGFVGEATTNAARTSGHELIPVTAPRLSTCARGTNELIVAAKGIDKDIVGHLASSFDGVDAVINAAGLGKPNANMTDDLVGANSLLPGLIVRASKQAGVPRVVHVSSAAVHGDAAILDPNSRPRPTSPYAHSKLWGEQSLAAFASGGLQVVIYRPTSVHGENRKTTEMIRRVARSPLSSVAGSGRSPTPQVMVESVGRMALELAVGKDLPDLPVVHPWEGWTTSSFLEYMGNGKRPLRIPISLASKALAFVKTVGRFDSRAYTIARRLELLWFGQRQPGSPASEVKPSRIVIATTVDASLGLLTGFPETLVNEGWDVHLVSSGGPQLARYSTVAGVTTHTISMARNPHPLRDLRALVQWIRVLTRIRPTVSYLGTPKASLLGTLAAYIARVPVRVYLIRGLRAETIYGMNRRALLFLEQLTMRFSTNVISVSDSLSNQILALTGYRSIVLGHGTSNGIDLTKYKSTLGANEINARRRNLGIPRGTVVLGFVGRITPDKGVEDLLGAIHILKGANVSVQLLLVGVREAAEGIGRQLTELADNIIEVGPVKNPEEFFALMDIFVLPSRREGFSNAVLEAAAMRVPIVGARSTGIIDFVEDRHTGFLVDQRSPLQIAQAIMYIIDNPDHTELVRGNAYKRVHGAYDRRIVQEIYACYLSTLFDIH